jgi:LMBR1 domain-containing protein 1
MGGNIENILLVVLIGAMALLLFGVNVYLLRLYLHPEDKRWNQAPYAKVIVILALTFCQVQALLIPLDVVNQSIITGSVISMSVFWQTFYLTLCIFLCVFVPLAILFYESDP